jgi:two-component system NtrC family sensor kinase
LMSESVGSLGALQRKFIERVKSSAERMNSLLDDLIRIMNLEYGAVKLQPRTIDINNVIDDAIIDTVAQIKEKNITLRVDLPESIPLVCTDPDALQQIVVHLLQNAGSATPPESTVDMRVQLDQADDQHTYLFLQVTDWGGGISQDDLPRVFSRQYRADNPLIQGLGDTGVGLSIARTLTEAQGGRIWVDSETGKSSTFSMLLPIEPEQKASPEAILSE